MLIKVMLISILGRCTGIQTERDIATKVATDILEFVLQRGEMKKDNTGYDDITRNVVI